MKPGDHVVIAGGACALGVALAERFLDEGASVAIFDADRERIAEYAERFEGEDIVFLECDVSDEEQVVDVLAQAVAEFGPVSGLVNCAALHHRAPLDRTGSELFRQTLEVNLTGAFITCKAALDEMADRLSIVNLSSLAATRPVAGEAAYGAAKAGVHAMSRVMAMELAGSGVRVNVVVPSLGKEEEGPDEQTGQSFAPIAAAVLFLLSDEASGVNGEVVTVGGMPSRL